MLDKTQVAKVAVAGFGAAMASVFAIPEAHATIIPISFNPGSVGYLRGNTAVSGNATVDVNTVSGKLFSAIQWNNVAGKTFDVSGHGPGSLASISGGATLSPGSFTGKSWVIQNPSASGNAYIGFKTAGNVGWFEVNWGGSGRAIKYIKGAYANAGESIVVGQMPAGVPEPGELGLMALGLLALGAAGVRLRREARKAAELN